MQVAYKLEIRLPPPEVLFSCDHYKNLSLLPIGLSSLSSVFPCICGVNSPFLWSLEFFSVSSLAMYQDLFYFHILSAFVCACSGRWWGRLITSVQSILLSDLLLRDFKLMSVMVQCIKLFVSFTIKARISCDGTLEVHLEQSFRCLKSCICNRSTRR